MNIKTDLVTDQPDDSVLQFISQSLQSDSYQLIPLAGDASSRRYIRVVDEGKSWVLMVWEPFIDNDEYPFLSVQRHFQAHGVHVPKIIALDPNKGLILLEDLGDLTLERKFWENNDQKNVLPFYKLAIDEILKIHFNASKTPTQSTCFKVSFDTKKFLWELNYAKEHLFEQVGNLKPTTSEEKILATSFQRISEILDKEPKRISHRDYHSRNLMLNLSKMYVIDFQDARLGPIQYDLVSLLQDSYVELDEAHQTTLIQYYLEVAHVKHGYYVSYDEFMQIFKIQSVQRCLKACGSFASFLNLRKDQRYLHYIHPTLVKVIRTLDELDDFSEMKNYIVESGLLELDYEAL